MSNSEKENFDGFKKTGLDSEIENDLEQHLSKFEISSMESIKLFPVLARRQWLKRFLAHYHLFEKTLDIPGDIAEFGVFRGQGLMTWANFLEARCVGDRTKTVYGFDNWTGFNEIAKEDGENYDQTQKEIGGFSPEKYFDELESAIKVFDKDRFISWKPRVKLVVGNIETKVSEFLQEFPGIRFSLLHFDCDLYNPTKAALEAVWDRVSRGGILLFDEYGIRDWPGETQAVDEFIAERKDLKLKTLDWTNAPAAYLVKP
jgi:hypothetical protein